MVIQKAGCCLAFFTLSAVVTMVPKIYATTAFQVQNPQYPDQKNNSGNPDANDPNSPNNPNNAHGPDKPVNHNSGKANTPKSSMKTHKSKPPTAYKKETGKARNGPAGPGSARPASGGSSQGDSNRTQ
jgi:hypothetical protein